MLRLRVEGLGFRVQGLGFAALPSTPSSVSSFFTWFIGKGSGFRVQGSGIRV